MKKGVIISGISCLILLGTVGAITAGKIYINNKQDTVTETSTYQSKEINHALATSNEVVGSWDVSENGDGSVTATLYDDGKMVISGTGNMKTYSNSSDRPYYDKRTSIVTIEIQSGVTSIGSYAFNGCSNLTSIEIPSSVTSIGSYAFNGCSNLTSIEIPSSVTSIGMSVFSGCSSLTSIEIPNSVTSIGWYAFSNCISLTSIEIPNSVTSIGVGAFSGCSSLTSIEIPSSVTSIGEYAFSWCSSLISINVDKNNEKYSSENGILFNKDKTEIICYPAGKNDIVSYIIPNTVTSIGSYAFYNCKVLARIIIPNSVTSIGEEAFYICTSLTIYCEANSVAEQYAQENKISYTTESIDKDNINIIGTWNVSATENDNVIATLYYDGKLIISGTGNMNNYSIYYSSSIVPYYNKKTSVVSVEIQNGVTSIGRAAFSQCSSLTSIEIPSSVTNIGQYTFYGCSSLTSIEIPNSVTSIESSAFEYCSGLTSIEIPNSVTSIGEYAFSKCSSLTSIKIPNSVTSIGEGTFNGCSSLTIYCKSNTKAEEYARETSKNYIIDDVAPIVNITGNSTSWTKGNITLTINASDELTGLPANAYSFDGGTTWQTENTKTYNEYVDKVVVQVRDKVGNITTNEMEIKIDKTAPTITSVTGNPTSWTKEDVTLTVNASDNLSGLAEKAYSFDNGTTWQAENTKTYTENTNGIVIKVKDNADNITTYQAINITKIDKTVPTITSVTGNPTSWTKGNVTLTVNASDDLSGLAEKAYSFDNGTTWQTENTKTYTENTNGIVIKVKDNLDNIATYQAINITKIDKTAPTITSVTGNPTSWTKGNVTLTVNASDNLSGLATKAYSFDNGTTWQTENTKTYSEYVDKVVVQVRDKVGNITTNEMEIKIDKTAPTITSVTGNPASWTKENVTLTVNASDNLSGLATKAYSFDNGTTWQAENTKTYTENTNGIVIKVKDNLDNIATVDIINITKIDKTAPTITSVTGNPTSWTKGNVTLTVNANDNLSGLATKAYSFDNGTTWQAENTKTYTQNTNGIVIKVKDNSDNITTYETINITKILLPESISIKTKPNKTTYCEGETLNTSGLVLIKKYNDGSQEEVTSEYTCTPTTLNTAGIQKITVTYAGKTTTFEVNVLKVIDTSEYKVENNSIKGTQSKTTLESFKKNITINGANTKILGKNNNELKNTDIITTGTKIKTTVNNKEVTYTIIVTGDTNGDGQADLKDMLTINKHRLNKAQLTDEYLSAGDVNGDGKVDIKDLLQINKFRLGKINSL